MSKKIIIGVIVTIGLATTALFVYPWKQVSESPLDAFAQCLADKGITMYGNYSCLHCQNEKKAFGDSFKYVPYVECTAEPRKCVDKGVQSVPTWIFPASPAGGPDGRKFVGEQGLEKLSKESGCLLPSQGSQ